MTDKQWARQLFFRCGIIIILLLLGVIGGTLIDHKIISIDSFFHVITYCYLAFALPFLFGLWFITIIVNTIILTVKKKTQLRNINLISFFLTMIIFIIILSYID